MAADASDSPRPAWQTDDLDEEWLEDDASSLGTQSISLTAPLPSFLQTPSTDKHHSEASPTSPQYAGTFLIRDDVPAVALLPKTPGRQVKKTAIKDFFSPLPLEKMFEPPSPPPPPLRQAILSVNTAPAIPSRLSQAFTPNDSQSDLDISVQGSGDAAEGRSLKPAESTDHLAPPSSSHKASFDRQFTFSAPRNSPRYPQAESTPGQIYNLVNPPMTDPRLRLFQLQYDTFTRDHLSAMVDSIAVNTPSGGSGDVNGSSSSLVHRALFNPQQTPTSDNSPIRSIKRVKLSPPSDFYGEGAGAGATISRPRIPRVDYVGESRSLMQQIKQARDFSTISTTVSTQSPATHTDKSQLVRSARVPSSGSGNALMPTVTEKSGLTAGSSTAATSSHSSLAIRQQAANLMQQIKNDMKGSKRLFSSDTEASKYSHAGDNRPNEVESMNDRSHTSAWSTWSQEKDNRSRRKSPKIGSPRRPSSSFRHHQSPKRLARSVSDDHERSLVLEMSNISIEVPWQAEDTSLAVELNPNVPQIRVTSSTITETLVPPLTQIPRSYPSSSVRSSNNDDLNRFVSSSTASGTTITASSAPSFVKHAGPVHITHITPSDVPSLPQRVGKMVYDKNLMKWMKASVRGAEADDPRDQTVGTDGESEDPFKDIDSLREDESGDAVEGQAAVEELEEDEDHVRQDMSRIEEVEEYETNDQEEVDLTSFTFDGPSVAAIRIIPSEDDDDDEEGDDETSTSYSDIQDEEPHTDGQPVQQVLDSEDELSNGPLASSSTNVLRQPATVVETTPIASRKASTLTTPVPKSALKSASVTPVSAMKDPSRDQYRTPAQRVGHRRSVSFSDGKRDGPIRGLIVKPHESDDDVGTSASSSLGTSQGTEYVPSARSKRLAEMMQQLEETVDADDSPTRSSTSGKRSIEELRPRSKNRRPSSQVAVVDSSGTSRRISSISRKDATFLTEWSFGMAHDRLVQVITDVEPFEPYWEELSSIDLSRKGLDSVARLKEFVPKLDSLDLNFNQLSWLSGIPTSVRTLSVASNVLTGVTSFNHLQNLENLDISNNEIESLTQLQCLRHLRELRADGNRITSLDGLQKLDALTKLSVQGNLVREVDLSMFRWPRLEMLNLSQNRLIEICSLASSLPCLIALNVDSNALGQLEPGGTMPRLRILRASNNRLKNLNVAPFSNLRTLYADNNSLRGLVKAERLGKLENLSLRNQSCHEFHVTTRQFRDVKRLYLSGNKLEENFIEEPCYNLVYLEVAACRLMSLPRQLGRLVPNLRVLNLNYNFLEDVGRLDGLTRLKKLTMIGSRLKGTKPLIRVLQRMPEVEMVDVRMNPCTLGWYLPLLVRDVPGALQPSEGGGGVQEGRGEKRSEYGWQELDSKFRRDLPDEAYVGRLAYRGLVMRACPGMRMLDGVEVTEKERCKASQLLQGIVGKNKQKSSR